MSQQSFSNPTTPLRPSKSSRVRKTTAYVFERPVISLDACEGCDVSRFMTKDPVQVPSTSTIAEIAQKMVDAHIHRVLVADGSRPCGVVSTTDIVAAVAEAERKSAHRKAK
jgi:CBS domain-containing protein